jgi:hypothetical protein
MSRVGMLLIGLALTTGCDGGGLGVAQDAGAATPDKPCQVLSAPPGVTQAGVYAPPPEIDCASITSILQDGIPMDTGTFSIQCSSSPRSSFISVMPHSGLTSEMIFEACE